MSRVSAAKRIQLQHVAEREVMRYHGNHALWAKHVHNVELDAVQCLKMAEMDQHDNTIDFSSRRTGKTAVKEMYELEQLATHADQELGIVSPREAQSLVNLGYHLDAIRRSPILSNYLAYKSGRTQMSDTRYEFMNRSKAQGYGIMAQVDGGDLTHASLEEVDDMPKDRLFSRFLLMLGSNRRLGAAKESKNKPQIRITGVFKGADTLTELLDGGNYHALGCLRGEAAKNQIRQFIREGYMREEQVELESYAYPVPILNAVNGMELGLLNEKFLKTIRGDLSEDEFVRQLLCVNTASRNLVWEIYLRRALQIGLDSGLELAEPMPGETYKKRGLISMGYDHSGHGESPQSSRYAVVILEKIGIYVVPIFCKQWAPGTDEKIVEVDLVEIWRYFMPDVANGDAFGVGLITSVNERLYREGLTTIDRRTIGGGDSTKTTWPQWAFSPIQFEGMTKHSMAQAVRSSYHNGQRAIPYFDDHDLKDPRTMDLRTLCRQTVNIRPVNTKTSYSSYKMANPKLGDDLFDADMAANWGFVQRGAVSPAVVVLTSSSEVKHLGMQPWRAA